jgi:hypothetical protein
MSTATSNSGRQRLAWREAALVTGVSGILLALAISNLPLRLDRAETPFEYGPLPSISPAYSLLIKVAAALPAGASVVPIAESRNALAETYFHRAAVGLLPRQKVFPAARWGVPTPEYELSAEYVIVLGQSGVEDAKLILRFPEGTVWRRALP